MSSFNSDRSRMDFYNQKRKPDPVPTYGGEDPCVNDRPNGNQPESGFVSKLWKEAVICSEAEARQDESERKQWKVKVPGKDGKEVKLREVYGVIVSCPTRFRDVGDTAIQADPGYAAVPWAIVRLCLTAGINEHEMYGVMIQGLELVSGLVTHYIVIERIFVDEHSDFVRAVQKLLLALYAAILDFLLEALSYFPPLHRDEDEKPWFRHKMKSGASKIKRTFQSLDPTVQASVKSLPTQVSSAKDNVDADANHAYATMNIQVMDELGNTENHILKQLEDIGLNEEERDRRLRFNLKEFLRGGNQPSINHVSTPLERLQRRLILLHAASGGNHPNPISQCPIDEARFRAFLNQQSSGPRSTPLHDATYKGYQDIARVLLYKYHSEYELYDQNSDSILHRTVQSSQEGNTLRLYLEYIKQDGDGEKFKRVLHHRNSSMGRTVMEAAEARERWEWVRLLKEFGA